MSYLFKAVTNTLQHWYIPLILGLLFILCGMYICTIPIEAYLGLSVLFSISFIISGAFDLFFSVQNAQKMSAWIWHLLSGILSLTMGIFLLSYPAISMLVLPFVVGFTVLFRSFQLLGCALELNELSSPYWGYLCLTSILGILFSFLIIIYPILSGMSLVALTAFTFIVVGISSMILSFDLRKIQKYPQKISVVIKNQLLQLHNEITQSL